jgi:hypothetical protein
VRIKHLYRHVFVHVLLASSVDDAHAAAADNTFDQIAIIKRGAD